MKSDGERQECHVLTLSDGPVSLLKNKSVFAKLKANFFLKEPTLAVSHQE